MCLRLKLESISIKILDAISQVLTVPLALDYLISKFLVLKSTNADSNSFHRDKCRTSNRTAYAKASLLLSRVTFMYYGFTKRRPVCSFSPYWKRKIKLTSIHKTKIKIPLSTTIRNDWPGLFSFNQNGLYRIFNEAQFIQQQLFLNSFQRASRFSNFSSFKIAKRFVDEWNRITPILVWSSDHVQINWLLNSMFNNFFFFTILLIFILGETKSL